MQTELEAALAYAKAGLRVFPGAPKTKRPAVSAWQQWATTDPDKIRAYWNRHPDANVCIATGKYNGHGYVFAVDVDVAKNKRGDAALHQFEAKHGALPVTLHHKTPSGGEHYLFTAPAPVRQGVNVLPGIDTRCEGGFVLGAGSDNGAGTYSAERIVFPASAPQALIEAIGKAQPTETTHKKEAMPGIDAISAEKRASHYLTHEAPPAIEGNGGDIQTYRAACRVKDLGITDPAVCTALLAEHYNPRCVPPWSMAELEAKAHNAYKYGKEPAGNAAPETQFPPVPVEPSTARPRLYFEWFNTVTPELHRAALIEGLLDHGAMSVLYGESNSGKTFVALDMAFHIAAGREWQGRRVHAGAAVYVAAEGGKGIRARIAALRMHYSTESKPVPLALVPCDVDLAGKGADVQPLIELIRNAEQASAPAAIVVIDTLSRVMAGGNENSPEDMTALIRNLDRIRSTTKAHVLVIHHSGKDKARGARGHSSLRAATDTELEVAERAIRATKQRDMEASAPIGFDLLPVRIGSDPAGREITSCVLLGRNLSATRAFDTARIRPGSVAGRALETLGNLALQAGQVTLAAWRDEFTRVHYPGNTKAAWTAFQRALKVLKDAGRIVEDGKHVHLA